LCFPENPPRILLLLPPSAKQRVSRYPFPLIYAFPRIPAPVHTLQGLPAPILLSLPLFLLLFLFFARSPVLLLSAFSFPLLRYTQKLTWRSPLFRNVYVEEREPNLKFGSAIYNL